MAGESAACAYCEKVQEGGDARRVTVLKDAYGRTFCDGGCLARQQDVDDAIDADLANHEAELGQELYG